MRSASAILIFIAVSSLGMAEMPEPLIQQAPIAETEPAMLPRPILIHIVRNSGQIFSGTVLQVEHHNSNSSSTLATTTVRFRVDEAIRGVQKGQVLNIKEWAGLWQAGRERYRPGERVLLFLYPLSKLGLTSPVGRSGRFAVDRTGYVVIKHHPRGVSMREMRRMVRAIRQREAE